MSWYQGPGIVIARTGQCFKTRKMGLMKRYVLYPNGHSTHLYPHTSNTHIQHTHKHTQHIHTHTYSNTEHCCCIQPKILIEKRNYRIFPLPCSCWPKRYVELEHQTLFGLLHLLGLPTGILGRSLTTWCNIVKKILDPSPMAVTFLEDSILA